MFTSIFSLFSMLFVVAARKILTQASSLVLGLTGVLFATHPIHTDAVSSVVGRAEVLSGMFVLLSFLAYTWSVSKRDSINFSYGWIVVSLLFAFLALFCKEQGITVVAINAAYDFSCVCGLDVVTFVSMMVSWARGDVAVVPTADHESTSTNPRLSNDNADDKMKKKSSRLPLHVQSFLKRLVVVGVGFAVIVFIRLKAGAKDMVPHRLTNRKPMLSIFVITLFNHVFLASNHIKKFFPRLMTKAFYSAYHAWLMLYPRYLNCDWSDAAFVY